MTCNADMGPAEAPEFCKLDESGKALVKAAMSQLQLNARAFHRHKGADAPAPLRKVAGAIADLDGSDPIKTHHLAEALRCRPSRQSHPVPDDHLLLGFGPAVRHAELAQQVQRLGERRARVPCRVVRLLQIVQTVGTSGN